MADNTTTSRDSTTVDRETVYGYRRSPGHHLTAEMERGSSAAVRLREVPFRTKIVLRAAPGSAARAALEDSVGLPFPDKAGEVSGSADGTGLAVLWFGPDDFLVVSGDEAETGVSSAEATDRLIEALGSEPGQVVDVSANRTTLELSGPKAREVLQKSCQVDLHPRSFLVGHSALTQLESTGAYIWRTGEDTWRIMPRASFTTYVARWLLDGMREYL